MTDLITRLRTAAPATFPLGALCNEAASEIERLALSINSDAVDALRKAKEAFDEQFAYCLSNGVFNAWGKSVPCGKINDAMYAVEEVLRKLDGPRALKGGAE